MSLTGLMPAAASPFDPRQSLVKAPQSFSKQGDFKQALADQDPLDPGQPAKDESARNTELSEYSRFSLFGWLSSAKTHRTNVPVLATDPSKSLSVTATRAAHHHSHQRYIAHPEIGDDAVAFGARAIVGPSFVLFETENIASVYSQLAYPEEIDALPPRFAEQGLRKPSKAFAGRPQPGHAVAGLNSSAIIQTTIQVTSPIVSTQMSRGQLAAASSVFSLDRPVVDTGPRIGNAQGTKSSTQTQTATMQAAQSSTVAQLLASPSEYRLTIRGKRLSESESENVVREISLALTQLGLALQPVRVMHQKGGA